MMRRKKDSSLEQIRQRTRAIIIREMKNHDGDVSAVAKDLGIDTNTMDFYLQYFSISETDFRQTELAHDKKN